MKTKFNSKNVWYIRYYCLNSRYNIICSAQDHKSGISGINQDIESPLRNNFFCSEKHNGGAVKR